MLNVDLYIVDIRGKNIEELKLDKFLSGDDYKNSSKYKREETRKEKLVSSYLKNRYIGEYYLSKDGKPLSKDMFFNVSHSKGVVVLVVSKDYPIGVDIEVIRDYKDDIAKYISNDDEYNFIKDNVSFFKIWTNKESLVKCVGTGINEEVKHIPALPLDDVRIYKGKKYRSQTILKDDYVISISLQTDQIFKINF